jgi:hypothetical protein
MQLNFDDVTVISGVETAGSLTGWTTFATANLRIRLRDTATGLFVAISDNGITDFDGNLKQFPTLVNETQLVWSCAETATGSDSIPEDSAACAAVEDITNGAECEAVLTKASDDAKDDYNSAMADVAACSYTLIGSVHNSTVINLMSSTSYDGGCRTGSCWTTSADVLTGVGHAVQW